MTQQAIVKLVGIGGAGLHALGRLSAGPALPATTIALDTDANDLVPISSGQQFQFGRNLTR